MEETQKSRKENKETQLSFWADMALIGYRHGRVMTEKKKNKNIYMYSTYIHIHIHI